MSGLREAFAEIAADVPVYGDLDRAIEQAEQERRRRYGVVLALAAAAAVLVVVAGVLTLSRATDTAPPITPTPTPVTPTPPAKSQSPRTWVDTRVAAAHQGPDWAVPDPLAADREAWLPVVTEHLDPAGVLETDGSDWWGAHFERPPEGSDYDTSTPAASAHSTFGRLGLMLATGGPNLLDDGCGYILAKRGALDEGEVSCSTDQLTGPGGEPARISRWQRLCGAYEGGGPASATCGDYVVGVAVERRDGLIGYVVVDGRGTPDFNPFTPAAMAAAAADPRLTLPEKAFAVPSDGTLVSVVAKHFPAYFADRVAPSATDHPGYAQTYGEVGGLRLSLQVWPAGGAPSCGRLYLVECVERRVFGEDDPTTVFVGAWDEEDWASCCPRNSTLYRRELVHVGPRHTVVVRQSQVVGPDEEPIDGGLDQRLIDLLLDPRLQ